MSLMNDSQQPAKRPRGRPRKQPGETPRPITMTPAARAQRADAIAARWGGRGVSRTVRVNPDAAEALATVPERDRRRVASDAIRAAVRAYKAG